MSVIKGEMERIIAGRKHFDAGEQLLLEMMNLKRATIKQQLSEPEFQSIQQILIGELKAIDMVINEFTQLFEIHESETEEAPMLDEKADLEKGTASDETN